MIGVGAGGGASSLLAGTTFCSVVPLALEEDDFSELVNISSPLEIDSPIRLLQQATSS